VRSVSRTVARPLAVAACACLLGAGASGCSTTQDKAAAKQIESEKILKAREVRQKQKKAAKQKRRHGNGKSKGKQ
jgi:hypothetical protein